MDKMAARIIEHGGKLKVRSALNPILWLCAIVSIPAMYALLSLPNQPTWLIFLICLPVGAAIFGFVFLLFFDRDKLQSEGYQTRKHELEIIQQKGDDGPQIIDVAEVEAISNPEKVRLLPKGKGGEK